MLNDYTLKSLFFICQSEVCDQADMWMNCYNGVRSCHSISALTEMEEAMREVQVWNISFIFPQKHSLYIIIEHFRACWTARGAIPRGKGWIAVEAIESHSRHVKSRPRINSFSLFYIETLFFFLCSFGLEANRVVQYVYIFFLIPGSSAVTAIFLLCIHKPWRRQKYFKALRPAIFVPKIVAFEGGLLHLALSGIISFVNSTTSFKSQLHTVIPKQYFVSQKLLAWFLVFFSCHCW